ncbi:MAG: YidC/Oxa1 family membrane protein insertase [Treponema sp.]|nr:YidC/Oxa1 family membrane protein insertase [Treponema sp.]
MAFSTILYNIILSPITQIIEISYRIFSKLFGNTGIAVLGVSFTVTLLCLPLYIVAEGWQDTERDIQSKMKSGIDRIKKAFKGDEQYMILNTYYRQNRYHPIMALRSSFGILIQIPFFLAAYHTLSTLPDLMGEHFFFIKDMGKPDAVFSIGSFSVNILPIAMTLINCISGAIYSKGHGIREKIQIYGMAALFLVVLYDSPAGLVLYWTMNNIFSLVKNVFYKMKNPLKVLYICMVAAIAVVSVYILFVYNGGANLKKRMAAVVALAFCIPIPLYLNAVDRLLSSVLSSLRGNKKNRFALFIISAIGLCVLTGLVLPSELISSSVQEFSDIESYGNPAAFMHSSFWMSFGLIIFWPTCIFFLFKEKIQTLLAFFFSSIFVGAILNAYLFSGNYGSMDVTLKFIDGFSSPSKIFILLNLISVIASLIVPAVLIKFGFKKILTNLCFVATFAFALLSVINTKKISGEYNAFAESRNSGDTQSVKFSLSKTKPNVVIFMLDRFESTYVESILDDQKDLPKKLDGFKFYPNCASFNGHTLMGSPALYGGFDYTPNEMNKRDTQTLKEKHNQSLILLPKLLCGIGFDAAVSDLSWANYSYIADMNFVKNFPVSENPELKNLKALSLLGRYSGDFKKEKLKKGYEKASLSHVLNRNLFWVSLFRESPAALRPVVYYKGTWWENGVKESSNDFANWYSILYYLTKIVDTASENPTLSILTNECTHSSEDISMYDIAPEYPYSVDDGAYKIDTVSLIQIGKFADYLRENGIYDNTRIIVVSDHGIGVNSEKYGEGKSKFGNYQKSHLNPVLLVKDFNSHTDGKVEIDRRFMTNADVPSIALAGLIEAPVNPFTGNRIDESYKEGGIIASKGDIFMPYHTKSEFKFTVKDDDWILLKDDIFVDSNWQKYVNE